ncbi:MAG: MBL fold metallo-hydrolase [Clostridia bacterium]|nr:MBL fold metallo-hydrolase [Clostridia bacterium]
MLKLYPLYSGSSGNMYLIKSPTSAVLVDIGVSFKSLTTCLENLGLDITNISALFITHEHLDHIKGLTTFINKTNIPIYTAKGTKDYILDKFQNKFKNTPNINVIYPETSLKVQDITITPFETSHDAADPVGYTLQNEDSTLTIATDLGIVSNNVYEHLLNSNLCVIESNYDRNLLMYGNYAYPLKCRIQSDIGHLSNDDTSNLILDLAQKGKRDFILGHISENNNEPEQAMFSVNTTLTENGFNLNDFNIHCATRDLSFEEYVL